MSNYSGLRIDPKCLEYRTIISLELINNVIHLKLKGCYPHWETPQEIRIWDANQQCCEARYITTDDDLTTVSGQYIKEINIKPINPDEACLEIKTNKGCITFFTHNDHNGYYGGFDLAICKLEDYYNN